ncbi:MAG TPA: alpha/beta hydrolase fold domain-containing protein, partial [Acidimicrobiales bacterium]|nr:alpha/beta hydrolase fold domain-containing protein [Acidimicrobiales bacterium]
RHGITGAFAGANLVYGCYDLSSTPAVRNWGDRNLVLSTPIVKWFTENYLPGMDREAMRDPDISPLYADLAGMPPALFTVGTLDMLLDDSMFMSARWRAAGNEAELRLYEEGIHAFNLFPGALGQLCIAAQVEFLRRVIA